MSSRAGNLYAWLGLILVVVVSDQVTKWMVLNTPAFNARACLDVTVACGQIKVSPLFDLTMLWNRGISFGTFQSDGIMRWVLVGATSGIAVAFAIWLTRAQRWLTALSLSLVIGGAIGNLVDRVRFGAVVDFLDFSGMYFPWVFNIADSAITVGAVLLFLDQFLMSRSGPKSETGTSRN
ncbi:signal peptidase II [Henriciella sp.]|uniref:signal peptidase II n=1 Tax=Henriciella sp. TaxID=1968823 RepID=UPI00260F1335|nr:signal peptidase II [Henriciella sp.]